MPIITDKPIIVANAAVETAPEPEGDIVVNAVTEESLLKALSESTDALAAIVVSQGGTIDENLDVVEIDWNPSVARMMRRKGQGAIRVHPFKLYINKQQIELNDNIVFLINKILIEL